MPRLLEQLQRMGLPALLDAHFPTHGHWPGLSLGWLTTSWLSAILSRGDPRLVHVDPWVGNRLWTLRATTGQDGQSLDCTDARLAIVRRRVRDDTRWAAFDAALNQHTGRGYDLSTARGHVESPSASASATGTAGGLFPCGHRTADRPDLPQVKGMQAVLEPLGMPLATAVVAGERADAPRSMPCLARGQARVGRHGRFSVGDCQMAARETRARSAAAGDFSLCPLPQGQRAEGECDAALAAVCHGAHVLSAVVRAGPRGQPEVSAQG
jgi:transposase